MAALRAERPAIRVYQERREKSAREALAARNPKRFPRARDATRDTRHSSRRALSEQPRRSMNIIEGKNALSSSRHLADF